MSEPRSLHMDARLTHMTVTDSESRIIPPPEDNATPLLWTGKWAEQWFKGCVGVSCLIGTAGTFVWLWKNSWDFCHVAISALPLWQGIPFVLVAICLNASLVFGFISMIHIRKV